MLQCPQQLIFPKIYPPPGRQLSYLALGGFVFYLGKDQKGDIKFLCQSQQLFIVHRRRCHSYLQLVALLSCHLKGIAANGTRGTQ